ncbi:MAG: hypothetical protein U9Q06_04905 [Nanoarchaeota archaeon]|nr:hypothetical protein [Nanoarchaeota archaeon]
MATNKKLKKAIESLKDQIERHFLKLQREIINDDIYVVGYYIKEIDKSLINKLESKMRMLGKIDKTLLENYRLKLADYKKRLNIEL